MPFSKNDPNINRNGRPPGKLNRSTEAAKLTLARVANRGLNNIMTDLEDIRKEDPKEAAKIYLKVLEFVLPKMKAVDMTVSGDIQHKVESIKVQVINGHKELQDAEAEVVEDN